MKLLLVHNYYQQRGGEDVVFESEGRLLEAHGHEVVRYTARNDDVPQLSPVRLALRAIWSRSASREVARLLRTQRPDLIHVHNTLPLISPAVNYAARAAGVPVVQTVHNYRLLCPSATLFRDGGVCEDCLHHALPLPGVRHACYRGSRAASATVAAMLGVHRMLGTWARTVARFIALTEFSRDKLIDGGLPADKVVVKPNFVPDPGRRGSDRRHALFVGRLSEEKGYHILLEAWSRLADRVPLCVIGDGPGSELVAQAARRQPGVKFLGRRSPAEVAEAMAAARFLVFPSIWYETFGLTIVEAFAAGTPVIASNLGVMTSLVEHGRTGLHFRAGDPASLVDQVEWALAHPEAMAEMGAAARGEYEQRFTPARNYELLLAIYRDAVGTAGVAHGRVVDGGDAVSAPDTLPVGATPRGARMTDPLSTQEC
jgi:glycosyltransferase involved in cell wall biosynthesis